MSHTCLEYYTHFLSKLFDVMDPPLRTSEDRVEPALPVNTLSPAPLASASAPSIKAARGNRLGDQASTIPSSQHRLDPSADDLIGQFSFAPATQTTVITTTTTTTTSFPPLMMKSPRNLHELDSKMYPLASSPTPNSIKRFCFDVGGKPTFFSEADDTRDTWEEVRLKRSRIQPIFLNFG